jgi:hypothetical protein
MRWDLGLQGLGLLVAMSLGFGMIALVPGIVAVLVTRQVTRRTRRHSTDVALPRPGTQRNRPTSGAV